MGTTKVTFRPGDRVVCVDDEHAWGACSEGSIYTVKSVDEELVQIESDEGLNVFMFAHRFNKAKGN